MRVLALVRYGRLGASSRVRFIQYLQGLNDEGVRVDMAPLFSDLYVHGLQRGRRSLSDIIRSYLGRIRRLLCLRGYDLLWVEKELLPWMPMWTDRLLLRQDVRYVLDYDDAVFHQYDQHPNAFARHLLVGKHPALMRGAALVVAGNEYLAEYARRAGAPWVEVVPTVVDLERYQAPRLWRGSGNEVPCVGWIGQRATASFLKPLAPVFEKLSREGVANFKAIGIDAQALGLPMEAVPWSEDSEAAAIGALDVGIMPLPDNPFERGKCGYKLIQYMACGLPVVASPVGVNRKIVEHGINGFLAATDAEWETALRTLATDPALRSRMGQAGRKEIERQYSLQVTGPRLAQLLRHAAAR